MRKENHRIREDGGKLVAKSSRKLSLRQTGDAKSVGLNANPDLSAAAAAGSSLLSFILIVNF